MQIHRDFGRDEYYVVNAHGLFVHEEADVQKILPDTAVQDKQLSPGEYEVLNQMAQLDALARPLRPELALNHHTKEVSPGYQFFAYAQPFECSECNKII